MGLVPMTPEMRLELEPIKHRCYVQLAAVRQCPRGMHGAALLLQWPPRFTLVLDVYLLLAVLLPRLVGLGHPFFSRFRLLRMALLHAASGAKRHTGTTSVCTACAQGGRDSLLPQAPCRQPFEAAVGQHSVAG